MGWGSYWKAVELKSQGQREGPEWDESLVAAREDEEMEQALGHHLVPFHTLQGTEGQIHHGQSNVLMCLSKCFPSSRVQQM